MHSDDTEHSDPHVKSGTLREMRCVFLFLFFPLLDLHPSDPATSTDMGMSPHPAQPLSEHYHAHMHTHAQVRTTLRGKLPFTYRTFRASGAQQAHGQHSHQQAGYSQHLVGEDSTPGRRKRRRKRRERSSCNSLSAPFSPLDSAPIHSEVRLSRSFLLFCKDFAGRRAAWSAGGAAGCPWRRRAAPLLAMTVKNSQDGTRSAAHSPLGRSGRRHAQDGCCCCFCCFSSPLLPTSQPHPLSPYLIRTRAHILRPPLLLLLFTPPPYRLSCTSPLRQTEEGIITYCKAATFIAFNCSVVVYNRV